MLLETRQPLVLIGALFGKNLAKQAEYLASLYEKQVGGERYFLHAHPDNEMSVELEAIAKLRRQAGVAHLPAGQCRVPWKCLAVSTTGRKGQVLRASGWPSNSPCILDAMRLPAGNPVEGPRRREETTSTGPR